MERTEKQTICALKIGYLQKNDEIRMDRVITHKTQSPRRVSFVAHQSLERVRVTNSLPLYVMATGEGSQLVYTPSVRAVVRESQEGIVYNKCLIRHSLPCSFLGGYHVHIWAALWCESVRSFTLFGFNGYSLHIKAHLP